jgi:hypothetical protein
MGESLNLTPADRRALAMARAELIERQQWTPDPTRARAIRLLGGMLEPQVADRLILATTPRGWVIGSGMGRRVDPPTDGIGMGLYILELAVANPNEAQSVVAFLNPGVVYKNAGLDAARKYVTEARQFVGEHCRALGAALEAVKVVFDEYRGPAAVYRPSEDAPRIATSYAE